MGKKNKLSNYIWPVVIAMILFSLLIGAMLLLNNQNQETNTLSEIKTTLSPEEELTQAALFNLTPQSAAVLKPADKIIIKTVNFDAAGNIAEIIMFTPDALIDGEISIEGKQVDAKRSELNNALILSFQVPESLRKKSVTFFVTIGGKQVAACSLDNSDTIKVSGDCIF
jgi:hypothetical protein